MGYLGVRLPHRLRSCAIGLMLLVVGFILIVVRCPFAGIFTLGCGYCVSVCACWPTIPLLIATQVPAEYADDVQSLAVGINAAGCGLAQVFSNLIVGVIKDYASYRWACVYFCFVAVFGIALVGLTFRLHRPIIVVTCDRLQTSEGFGPEDGRVQALLGKKTLELTPRSLYRLEMPKLDQEYYQSS